MSDVPQPTVEVIVNDERRPVLYDATGAPLVRVVGFRPRDPEGAERPGV